MNFLENQNKSDKHHDVPSEFLDFTLREIRQDKFKFDVL